MTIVLLVTLVACGNKTEPAEKYCWSCGKGITNEVAFCGYCGASVKNNQDDNYTDETNGTTSSTESTQEVEQPSDIQTPAETQKPTESQKPTETQKPTESQKPAHTHSYSKKVTAATCTQQGYTTYTCSCGDTYTADQTAAKGHSYSQDTTPATCTQQGYTTYTCSCGDSYKDDYTNPSHNYTNYKCSQCGSIDKSHSYDYLVAWVKANGTTSGGYTKIQYTTGSSTYALSYSAQYNSLSIQRSGSHEGTFTFTSLYLDTFYYGSGFGDLEMCGYITPSSFTSNTAISYTKFNGDSDTRPAMAELARVNICDLIDWLDWCLGSYGVGITIRDLGFRSY